MIRMNQFNALKRPRSRTPELTIPLDDDMHEIKSKDLNPEALLLQMADTQMVRQALEDLPVEFREVLVLREWEGLSYKQIADVVDIPMGTVMSRLALPVNGSKKALPV